MAAIETEVRGDGRRVAVVVSRFNNPISLRLLEACEQRLAAAGCTDVDVAWVPGAFEIPLAAQVAADSGRYDAVVTLGAVIRGGTPHFDYVCRGVTDGVREAGQRSGVPVAFAVLTTDTAEQALERAPLAGELGSNKGAEAAEVALEMASLLEKMRGAK
jgi:6,7-dimethyl-8-ribityllumazine synthase